MFSLTVITDALLCMYMTICRSVADKNDEYITYIPKPDSNSCNMMRDELFTVGSY